MEAKDEIIQDIYISSKSFIDFYSKIFIPKLKAENINQVKVKNLNIQIMYNYTLLIRSLKANPIFSYLNLKKTEKQNKTYEEVNNAFRLIIDYNENKQTLTNDPTIFLDSFLKLKEELICLIAKTKKWNLHEIAVEHSQYGLITLRELIYLIISSNYQYLEICKRVLVRRMEVAV